MTHNIAKIIGLSALALSSAAFAQTAAPEPDYTLTYNVGAVTEYRYRGISQSAKKPALQAGADFAHKNGFYLGTWGSTISWIKDSGTGLKGPVEVDIYGGYKGAINETFSYDVGVLQYWYVNNNLKNAGFSNANTTELYAAVSAGPATVKYSQSVTDLFGSVNSKGSGYLDASATFDLGNGFSVVPHIGRQVVKRAFAYTDYSVALNKDIDGLVLSATLLGTNIKSTYGTAYTLPGSGSKDLAGTTLVLGIKKNF